MIFGGDFIFKAETIGTLVDQIRMIRTDTLDLTFAQNRLVGHVKKSKFQRTAAGIDYQYFHFSYP